MTDYDVNPHAEEFAQASQQVSIEPRLKRNPQEDLHLAIDLAYTFANAIKELHPFAEKQVKGMIFQGNLI